MQKITPFLWFDDQAEEAVDFYLSVFADSRVTKVTRYSAAGPGPEGSVMTVSFVLDGEEFMALNGGPHFTFNEALSLFVRCDTQEEVDDKWERLSAGGEKGRCGWLKDRFGVSWQIVPNGLLELLEDRDSAKSRRAMQAMLQMTKLDIRALQRAYDSE